ncbi:CD276 antigen isoform X2 [Engraulis encrasicolus]|uniref:CD276 antigen isoform X2 n=1 Tax=Engraulis encrasicolus TaxID=184585 RepID=UPI002FD5193E
MKCSSEWKGGQSFLRTARRATVGNLGQDAILDCSFTPKTGTQSSTAGVSVTWEKEGLTSVVYRYQNQAPDLADQNPAYKDRAQIFPDLLGGGNASLRLQRVRRQDEGVYKCSVSAPSGHGSINIHLWVAAYSAPTFKLEQPGNLLSAEAARWYPKPNVTWEDVSGHPLDASTELLNNSAGIFRVTSRLQEAARQDETYTLVIRNHLVSAIAEATLTGGSNLSVRTDFTFNAAAPRMLSSWLVPVLLLLCLLLPKISTVPWFLAPSHQTRTENAFRTNPFGLTER